MNRREERSNQRAIVLLEEENQRKGTGQIIKSVMQEIFAELKIILWTTTLYARRSWSNVFEISKVRKSDSRIL